MKIDLHVHTRKVKSGDSPHRNVEVAEFGEIIKNTDVSILAITNHNHFDLKQYAEFLEVANGFCEIWPGIELDIMENGKRAHLIVICNPKEYVEFNKRVEQILYGKSPDTFTISLIDTVKAFGDLDTIYIAHYYVKTPDLGDEEIDLLLSLVPNPKRVIKEASNSISAGIYISHGHKSIYGSDLHDWRDYIEISKNLPELRLPVESYEQFCLLLEKDDQTINTILSQKIKESIQINPFGIAELVNLDIYNDINIIFGSKGTGKTDILKAISKFYNDKGYKTDVYESNSQHVNDLYDLKGIKYVLNLEQFGIDNCEDDISKIKEAEEREVTSITKYSQHFDFVETNKIAKKIKIQDITFQDESLPKRKLEEIINIFSTFSTFEKFVLNNDNLSEIINQEMLNELSSVLQKINTKLKSESESRVFDKQSIILLNHIIQVFSSEISKKTSQPQKPMKTGFAQYSSNRIAIERSVQNILKNLKIKIAVDMQPIGSLGVKGELYCQTNLIFQNGDITDGKFSPVSKVFKGAQKQVAKKLVLIAKHIYTNDLFTKIADLNATEGITTINSLSDLILFNRHFSLNSSQYEPSNGESSMLLLHNELLKNKDIYLIDEPEKSLGNDYINDVIVPMLKNIAKLGKKIIIATHDANIAVRTLPYNSIYRLHNTNQSCYTFVGNPFTNSLKCINGDMYDLDWKEISMKTLEGGRSAFGERGKIYGK